jgi:putative endonuclease
MSIWSVYIVRCADDTLYTGIAIDVTARLRKHHEGRHGAKYLRGRGPLQLLLSQEVGDRGLASRVEYRLKQLAKPQKLAICASPRRLRPIIDAARRSAACEETS